jgi:membrane protein
MNNIPKKLILTVRSLIQRFLITVQLYGSNGLSNHAAACSYGFLLSMAPMLILIVFFIFNVFKLPPKIITVLFGNIPFLSAVFDKQWLTSDFFLVSKLSISGIISIVSIFWAGRILALSVQCGIKVIFPGEKKRNPAADNLVTFSIEIVALIIVLIAIMCSQTALNLYKRVNIFTEESFLYEFISHFGDYFPVVILGLVSFFLYLFVPVNSPRKISAFQGALLCSLLYSGISLVLDKILNQSKYDFLYGTLGNLIVILVNVYFFFILFFIGCQLVFVRDSFDILLFSRLRHARSKAAENNNKLKFYDVINRLFYSEKGRLEKYLRNYKDNSIIFSRGDTGKDIYYLLEGEVEILLPSSADNNKITNTLKAGSFFGEMGYLLSEDRTATVRAKTCVSAFALPEEIFEGILKYDNDLDRNILEQISGRLKKSNEQIAALKSAQ